MKETALDLGLPVTTKVDDVIDVGVDLGVVVAFGQLIKPHVLDAVPMVNVHFSLLPRWRGAAPVERAILAGDTETGVCLMELEEGLDTGAVFACEQIADRTTGDRRRASCPAGGDRQPPPGRRARRGLGTPTPQEGEPTYAAKIDPADLEIDWTRPAVEIARLVRVGRAWTTFRGNRLLVVRGVPGAAVPGVPGELRDEVVATGEGSYVLEAVQPEGKERRRCSRRGATARALRQASGSVRDRPTVRSRSRRSCTSSGRCLRQPRAAGRARAWRPRRPRPSLRHRARVRHVAHAAGVRLAGRPVRREAA